MHDAPRQASRRALRTAGALVLSLLVPGAFAADKSAKAPVAPRPDYIPFDDPKLVELLKKIDAAGRLRAPRR